MCLLLQGDEVLVDEKLGVIKILRTILVLYESSLVPRRQIERLVSNVYVCAKFYRHSRNTGYFPFTSIYDRG